MTQLQLDMAAQAQLARSVGDLAGTACAVKAERVSTFTVEAARDWVITHLHRHGPTSGEDLVDGMVLAGIKPHDTRAFGPVFASLSREKRIAHYGYAARRRGHGTAGGIIWRIVR
jgi:hypothetical protein